MCPPVHCRCGISATAPQLDPEGARASRWRHSRTRDEGGAHAARANPNARVFDPRLVRIATFLNSIGIATASGPVEVPTAFPGSLILHGALVVEEEKLVSPGDVLHEAAHIALAPPERRESDFAFLRDADPGEEIATIAWCWAALVRLALQPEDVFHGTAYPRGDSPTLIEACRRGNFIGFPLLQVWGMAYDQGNALARGVEPFPHMVRWVRP